VAVDEREEQTEAERAGRAKVTRTPTSLDTVQL